MFTFFSYDFHVVFYFTNIFVDCIYIALGEFQCQAFCALDGFSYVIAQCVFVKDAVDAYELRGGFAEIDGFSSL